MPLHAQERKSQTDKSSWQALLNVTEFLRPDWIRLRADSPCCISYTGVNLHETSSVNRPPAQKQSEIHISWEMKIHLLTLRFTVTRRDGSTQWGHQRTSFTEFDRRFFKSFLRTKRNPNHERSCERKLFFNKNDLTTKSSLKNPMEHVYSKSWFRLVRTCWFIFHTLNVILMRSFDYAIVSRVPKTFM